MQILGYLFNYIVSDLLSINSLGDPRPLDPQMRVGQVGVPDVQMRSVDGGSGHPRSGGDGQIRSGGSDQSAPVNLSVGERPVR